MYTENKNTIKSAYLVPAVEQIKLDNQMSLALESNPPAGPNETYNQMSPEQLNNKTFIAIDS